MNYFKDNKRSSGGNSGKKYGGRRDFGGGGSSFGDRDSVMHPAICSECDQECEVPFKPTSGKPVFCKKCFKKQDDSRPSTGGRDFGRSFGGDRDSKPSFAPRPAAATGMTSDQFKILNSKLDKILEALEN